MRAAWSLVIVPFGLWLARRGSSSSSSSATVVVPPLPKPFGDARRLKTLDAIVPEARPHFDALLAEARSRGLHPYITSAVRTCAEEHSLAHGSKSGRSWHLLGRAVDIELTGAPLEAYEALAEWWENRGGTWGGRWTDTYPSAPGGIPPGAAGDPLHWQWTGGKGSVPVDVWPLGAPCDAIAQSYLSSQGAAWTPLGGWSS